MPEYVYVCPDDQHFLTAPDEAQLAKLIQQHIADVHEREISYENALEMAGTSLMTGSGGTMTPEYMFTCPHDHHVLTAPSERELATKIQEHMKMAHDQRISYRDALNMARSPRQAA